MNIRSEPSRRALVRRLPGLFFAVTGLALLISSAAQAEQGAEAVVRQYQAALIEAMKLGKPAGFEARYNALTGPVSQAFDLGFIAQRAAGPAWATFTADQRKRYVAAFTRYSVAEHASRFDSYDGEKFVLRGTDDVGRGYVRVRTQIITGSGEAIELDYLLGKRRGAWRIVDVFAKGTISEVARYRADFASELQRKGAEGLIQALDRKTAQARGA